MENQDTSIPQDSLKERGESAAQRMNSAWVIALLLAIVSTLALFLTKVM